jgi:hypothetical protein
MPPRKNIEDVKLGEFMDPFGCWDNEKYLQKVKELEVTQPEDVRLHENKKSKETRLRRKKRGTSQSTYQKQRSARFTRGHRWSNQKKCPNPNLLYLL